ncbi:FISUMP domain-containing protein [Agromyces protaetiae]|uniref:FISUMP domain-containing protein n=1 Tax=Agromyces protaetiae TaxID=2509455 RepID=UPI0013EA6634|nr:FISUMP domain-containing protein [Agromyces protaetiae]
MAEPQRGAGFTIVELLIVIVVIAILATITVVSYNGVVNQANETAVKSDLQTLTSILELDSITSGSYPATANAANGGRGLALNGGRTVAYTSTGDTYCVAVTGGSITFSYDSTTRRTVSGACDVGGGGGGGDGTIADGSVIQTITAANCLTTRTRAVDARDNHTYWVQKLADGKCWMLTNLGYAGGGTNTYADVKSLANGTGGSTTYTAARYYVVPGTTNFTTEPTAPSISTDGTGQYGYFYNWCAAMGAQTSTSACANATTPTPSTTISICPAGWRLPRVSSGDFSALNTAINGGSATTDAGLRTGWLTQRTGWWDSGFKYLGSDGNYWSSTQSSATNAYQLNFGSSYVYPADDDYKLYGLAVRCVAV